MVTTATLVKIAGWGGIVVTATGLYLRIKIVDRVREYDYYKSALKLLRAHSGAVFYLGEPIKDRRFTLSDSENNFSDGNNAMFTIPVCGPKDKGTYYFWAQNINGAWNITKAELSLKSRPNDRLVIVKENNKINLEK